MFDTIEHVLDELRALAVFAKVVDVGSFRGAARALSLAPSVVSHHVKELESRLGVPLLYRSTRHLSLTPAGMQLADDARAMAGAAERALDGVRGRATEASGTLRVTLPAFLAETALCRDLASFALAHPRVRLVIGFTDAPKDLLRDGFDLALRIGVLQDSTHRVRRLGEMRRVLVAAPSFVAGRAVPQTPADLESWPFIHLSSRPTTVSVTSARGRKVDAVTVRWKPAVSVDSAAALRELTLAGVGLATLPEVLAREALEAGRLREVLPGWRVANVPVAFVWPAAAVREALTRRFADTLGPPVVTLFAPATARSM